MDLQEFSRLNRERCESSDGFGHALHSWSTSDWFTATLGELGEAANVAKKLNRIRDGQECPRCSGNGVTNHDVGFGELGHCESCSGTGVIGNKETEQELRDKLAREIADTFIYLDLLAQSVDVDLSEVVPLVFNAKSKKIGYSTRLCEKVAHRPICDFFINRDEVEYIVEVHSQGDGFIQDYCVHVLAGDGSKGESVAAEPFYDEAQGRYWDWCQTRFEYDQ